MLKHNETKVRRQEINYNYNDDANIIPEVNNYLMSGELDMKLIKLTLNVFDNKIRIVFRSNFEVRKQIADKLRELDIDTDGAAIKRKLFFKRLITMKDKVIEDALQSTGDIIPIPECPAACAFERVEPKPFLPVQISKTYTIPKVDKYDIISAMNRGVAEPEIKFEEVKEPVIIKGGCKIKIGGENIEWFLQSTDNI